MKNLKKYAIGLAALFILVLFIQKSEAKIPSFEVRWPKQSFFVVICTNNFCNQGFQGVYSLDSRNTTRPEVFGVKELPVNFSEEFRMLAEQETISLAGDAIFKIAYFSCSRPTHRESKQCVFWKTSGGYDLYRPSFVEKISEEASQEMLASIKNDLIEKAIREELEGNVAFEKRAESREKNESFRKAASIIFHITATTFWVLVPVTILFLIMWRYKKIRLKESSSEFESAQRMRKYFLLLFLFSLLLPTDYVCKFEYAITFFLVS